MLKKMMLLGLLLPILLLVGCGQQLIKPEAKKVQAMLEFEMPDYDPTTQNVVNKIEDWMKKSADYNDDKVEFEIVGKGFVKGTGIVSCKVRNEQLRVKFKIKAEVISPKLVKISMNKFEDLPGESDSSSDFAYIFYNKVKDQALDMTDRLESYLNEDTGVETILEIQ